MESCEIPDGQTLLKFACDKYREHFKSEPAICASAPGRVNLIGEHTDYNDGFVLPMALPMVTLIVGETTNNNQCHILTTCEYVDDTKEVIIKLPTSGGNGIKPGHPTWANYIKGVMAHFKGKLCGFNAVITTSVPIGGGLSSSAALEVATYSFLNAISPEKPAVSMQDKVRTCQKAEHEFANVPCGVMDQFVSFNGKENHALLLDCRELEFVLVPMQDPNVSVLITNTNVRHKLTGSEYSTRKRQCEEAASCLGKSSLRDVDLELLERCKEKLNTDVYRRARHVVTEIRRTTQAATALEREEYYQFGRLMNESHESLKDDFEVSCNELDQVADAAIECNGVYGSRMTGGGFGGCTVTLLKTEVVPHVIQNIKAKYSGNPSFYVCRPCEGAQVLKLQ